MTATAFPLIRAGYLAAHEFDADRIVVLNEDPCLDPDLPSIELTHDYHLTPAGANAIALFEAGVK